MPVGCFEREAGKKELVDGVFARMREELDPEFYKVKKKVIEKVISASFQEMGYLLAEKGSLVLGGFGRLDLDMYEPVPEVAKPPPLPRKERQAKVLFTFKPRKMLHDSFANNNVRTSFRRWRRPVARA